MIMKLDGDLDGWLRFREQALSQAIEPGLGRVRAVIAEADLVPRFPLITVAGTNGKGSVAALLEAIFGAAGLRVGVYGSPHLLRFNERIRIAGADIGDAPLAAGFARTAELAGARDLTVFEFDTVLAMQCFLDARVEVGVLEVGMGGRLDAVNAWDADVAVITSIGVDHAAWLGPDREAIGFEKAGILRPGRAAVCGDRAPPASIGAWADRVAAPLYRLGREFEVRVEAARWDWQGPDRALHGLPLPGLAGRIQIDNAAVALMAVELLPRLAPLQQTTLAQGLRSARLPGRLQIIPGEPELWLDVGHNPAAAQVLARELGGRPCAGRTIAIYGALRDKDVTGVAAALKAGVDHWLLVPTAGPRGLGLSELADRLGRAQVAGTVETCENAAAALAVARDGAGPGDRIVAFGAFAVVSEVMCRLKGDGQSA